MRGYIMAGGLALVLAACGERTAAPEGAETASEMAEAAETAAPPRLAPGLWRVSSTSDGTEAGPIVQMCLDDAVQQRIQVFGAQAAAGACEESRMTARPGGGWTLHSVCDMGQGGRTISDGVVTGDFTRAYRVESTSVTTGAALAQMNGTSTVVSEANLAGPCPEGMRPGDMELPGGMRINMAEMAAAAAGGAAAP